MGTTFFCFVSKVWGPSWYYKLPTETSADHHNYIKLNKTAIKADSCFRNYGGYITKHVENPTFQCSYSY